MAILVEVATSLSSMQQLTTEIRSELSQIAGCSNLRQCQKNISQINQLLDALRTLFAKELPEAQQIDGEEEERRAHSFQGKVPATIAGCTVGIASGAFSYLRYIIAGN